MKTIFVDVMMNGHFVMQFRYRYSALFPIDINDVRDKATELLPSLRGKDFNVEFTNSRVL